ncbi:MAG: hypothetical protein RJB13_1566, partial [Pseudomonadota bacterium]
MSLGKVQPIQWSQNYQVALDAFIYKRNIAKFIWFHGELISVNMIRSVLHIPDELGTLQGIWQRLMFSDVKPLLKALKGRAGQESDLHSLIWVKRIFSDKHDFPEKIDDVLPRLRASVMKTVTQCERVSLLKMFSVHIVDVICSVGAALLAVNILRSFENRTSGSVLNIAVQSIVAAILVFVLNVLSSSLHAQKIERESLVVFRVQAYLTRWINAFILNLSRREKGRYPTGDIVNLAQTDSRHIAEFFAHAAVDFPVLFVSVTLIVAVMWSIVGPAAWIALFVLLLQIPVSVFFSWLGQRLHGELMKRSDTRLSLVTEWIQAARLVRYFGWSKRFVDDIRLAARREFLQDLRLKAHYSTSFGLSTSWWMLVAVGVFAGFLWFHQEKSASQVFAAIWLSSILGQQLNPLPWFIRIYAEAKVGSERLESVFRAQTQAEDIAVRAFSVPADVELSVADATSFSDVEFVLDEVWVEWSDMLSPALKNLSCVIPANNLTAIVGPVGAGKSVLIQVLMAEITPTRGCVFLRCKAHNTSDEFKTIELPLHTPAGVALLRRVQTFVPQEAFVAAATVRENVPLRYLSDIDLQADVEVVRALECAQLGIDLNAFPAGLSTELGERGVNLSGGQKQRLSLARAVHAQRPLVFLDDPLSAVDSDTETQLV